ncbi:hypothetical protein LTR35_017862, partial [Friedmanniomyces endolithicus]
VSIQCKDQTQLMQRSRADRRHVSEAGRGITVHGGCSQLPYSHVPGTECQISKSKVHCVPQQPHQAPVGPSDSRDPPSEGAWATAEEEQDDGEGVR